MPCKGSRDGKWTGEDKTYTVQELIAEEDLIDKSFTYDFGDGWVAKVQCRLPRPNAVPTDQFCGYEWMIESIITKGAII